jgi:hypothetical protein
LRSYGSVGALGGRPPSSTRKIRIRSKRGLVPWILNFKKNQAVLRCSKHIINQTKIKYIGIGMPEISGFLGVIIAMYYKDHPPPHFHAKYEGQTGVFTIADL